MDGYNIIFAWDELKALAKVNLDAAREALLEILSNYQGYRGCKTIAVFDAYKRKGGQRRHEQYHNIEVVFTKEAETADSYIEKTTYEIGKRYYVRVATSDSLEQMIILGNGAFKVSAKEFREEIRQADAEISSIPTAIMTINQLFELVFLMSKKFYVNVEHFNISDIILSETNQY